MKFRFKPSENSYPLRKRDLHKYKLRGRDMPRILKNTDPIDLSNLFEFAALPEAVPKKKIRRRRRKRFKKFLLRLAKILLFPLRKFSHGIDITADYLDNKIRTAHKKHKAKAVQRRRLPSLLPMLWGGFFGALTVCVLSAVIIFVSLFSGFIGGYTEFVVPDLLGERYDSGGEFFSSSQINYIVTYEYVENTVPGTVISQTPSPGVIRRIYKGEDFLNLSLTVSLGDKNAEMPNLIGMTERNATLALKNMGANYVITEEYSDIPKGTVISTFPDPGRDFQLVSIVSVTISLGEKTEFVSVPNLYGLTEIQAITLLMVQGLLPGEITYAASNEPTGKVIAQGIPAYSSVTNGSSISFTVSAGYSYKDKIVPNLYGIQLTEAKTVLAERGIMLGIVYVVTSSEPKGTVIAQSPSGGSTATSTTVVNLYVSG